MIGRLLCLIRGHDDWKWFDCPQIGSPYDGRKLGVFYCSRCGRHTIKEYGK